MSFVIDIHGNLKTVPDGYVLQNGENYTVRVPMMAMDGAASRTLIQDSQVSDSERAYQAMNENISNAWRGDGPSIQMPAEIFAALPVKHQSVFGPAIADVVAARGNPPQLRTAIEDLKRHSFGLRPMPGSLTADMESAVERGHQWVIGFCDGAEKWLPR